MYNRLKSLNLSILHTGPLIIQHAQKCLDIKAKRFDDGIFRKKIESKAKCLFECHKRF